MSENEEFHIIHIIELTLRNLSYNFTIHICHLPACQSDVFVSSCFEFGTIKIFSLFLFRYKYCFVGYSHQIWK